MNIKLSIIIPHKNSYNKISRLLDSIPDFHCVEIIIVDDKSEEGQYENLCGLVKQGLIIIKNEEHESNAGVARNIGLNSASGEWVVFADADDEFYKNGLAKIIKIVSENPCADVICFGCCAKKENGEYSRRADVVDNLICNYPANSATILYEWVVPWGKAIKRTLIKDNSITFDSCLASNDVMFSTKLANFAKKVIVCEAVTYCCYESKGSLTSSITEAKAISRLSVLVDRNLYLHNKKVPVKKNYGFTYFLYSKPWRFSQSKIHLYKKWLVHFWVRLT